MALITRVSRLFQADFHAVLDRIEEPEVLLRQAVREMEEELARDEQHSKVLHHEQGQLTTRESIPAPNADSPSTRSPDGFIDRAVSPPIYVDPRFHTPWVVTGSQTWPIRVVRRDES